jgi:lipid A 3-O-deacylase
MTQPPSFHVPARFHINAALGLCLAVSLNPALAQPVGQDAVSSPNAIATKTYGAGGAVGRLGLHYGYNDDYQRLALVYNTPAFWSHRFANDAGRIDLNAELGLAYWDARRGTPTSMWQLSAIPLVRWWPVDTVYLEAGVGPTVLSRSRFAERNLGTRLQFGSHFGVGMHLGAHRFGLRYSHFSNADIAKDNPGLDLVVLSYSYAF